MIAIIDYGAGNTRSVSNALAGLKLEHIVTNDEKKINDAEKIIFPGVGEAAFAMKMLKKLNLVNIIVNTDKPVLGICLGMQLLFDKSEESNIECLSIIPGKVKRFDSSKLKVPHMGWNKVNIKSDSRLFEGIKEDSYFYFAHSYYVPLSVNSIAQSNYGKIFCASVRKSNFYGVQFHPEKSGSEGLRLLTNFVELC